MKRNKPVNKPVSINKKNFHKSLWSAGNAIMIVLTFVFGSWFVLFASMYAFLMGFKFCQNNWIVGTPKVQVTNIKNKKNED